MKKNKWSIAGYMILSSLIFSSCSKQEIKSEITTTTAPAKAKTSVANMTAGKLHNFLLTEYKTRFGLPKVASGVLTTRDMQLLCSRLTDIMVDNGMLITSNPTAFSDALYNSLVADGFFDNNGVMVDLNTRATLCLNKVQDPQLHDVFSDIYSHLSDAEYLSYSNQKLATLINLNSNQQFIVDGYRSVMNSSEQFWQNEPILYPMGIGRVVEADRGGWNHGCSVNVSGAWYLITVITWPASYAALHSLAAVL